MKKEFNITGVCIPEMHYMVDISCKLDNIEKMVDSGYYFVINRPRQYGKTTTLNELSKRLNSKYVVIDISFEAISDKMFESEENFCTNILTIFSNSTRITNKPVSKMLNRYQRKVNDFNDLSMVISEFVEEVEKDVVLLIDEVDKNSNSRMFLKFLALLRNKYLSRQMGKDITFKSVILSGVHDIKNLKLSIREEEDVRFNSPWNIAMEFDIDMSFNPKEIESMLRQYCIDENINFNIEETAIEIYKFTNGYPYIVSNICYIIHKKLNKDWTIKGVHRAVKIIISEKSTLFDDIIKNIENNTDVKRTIWEILIDGIEVNYNPYAYEKPLMYGILREKEGKVVIHNKIFEEAIYNYFIESEKIKESTKSLRAVDKNQFIENDKLNMEKVLLKFQELMYQEYRVEDKDFYESQGRLIFLAFLKPILNGKGFYFVEANTRQNKRMDIVITYGLQKEVVELKIWRGEKYEQNGIEQLADYLEIQRINKGYMLTFDLNNSRQSAGWVSIGNKEIFEVIV